MLSELVPIPLERKDSDSQEAFSAMEKAQEELCELGAKHLQTTNEARFRFRAAVITFRGIPEDFKVFWGNALICECVYGDVIVRDKIGVQSLLILPEFTIRSDTKEEVG